MSFADAYKFVVDAAKERFPSDLVWGQLIHDGNGYGLFVMRQGIKVCFQVKSKVNVGGKEVDNDIRNHGSQFKIQKALNDGFDSMEKSLIELLRREKPKGLLTRIKEAVFS